MKTRKCTFVLFTLLLTAIAVTPVFAQMTIFNIPSTEVLEKKGAYLEGDLIAHPAKLRNGGYQTYGWRGVFGVGGNTDVGANVYYTRDENGSSGEVQLTVQHTLISSKKNNAEWTVGMIASEPIRDPDGDKTYGFFYTNASKKFDQLNDLEITGGLYGIVGGGTGFGTKAGVMLGVEQPIYKGINFEADWQSGHNRLGYVSGGLYWELNKHHGLTTGYSVGNSGRGNNYLSIIYGYTF